jgi:hypothetical protein
LLFCIEAYAVLTHYSAIRDYVEKHNPNNHTPATNRIFIEFNWNESAIVQYHDGMKLDDAIKQAKLKCKAIFIFVFRGEEKPRIQQEPVFDSRFTKIKSSDFVIKPLDAIDLTDEGIN